jgi:hypothetical protein
LVRVTKLFSRCQNRRSKQAARCSLGSVKLRYCVPSKICADRMRRVSFRHVDALTNKVPNTKIGTVCARMENPCRRFINTFRDDCLITQKSPESNGIWMANKLGIVFVRSQPRSCFLCSSGGPVEWLSGGMRPANVLGWTACFAWFCWYENANASPRKYQRIFCSCIR